MQWRHFRVASGDGGEEADDLGAASDPGQLGWHGQDHILAQQRGAKRAVSLGATVIAGPTDGPADAAVTIADPDGARLALFRPHAGQG